MLSSNLFKDWEKLYVSIIMIFLFAYTLHNDNEVKSCAALIQHHNNINKMNKWNESKQTKKRKK